MIFKISEAAFSGQKSNQLSPLNHLLRADLAAFDEDEETDLNAARPIAIFTGEINEFEIKINSADLENFYWFLVETLGGEVDIVVDPKLITTKPANWRNL